ncbi:MAG: DNA mismatch repair endonuclease MutL [Chitinophagales bacterium]
MSDVIKLLPDAIANQIAAGEVIQRPASAVKEMLENAIDAGSTRIQLIIKDAGKTLIQVIDNGSGMSETDARMSFERHATSKITRAQDLFSIRTLGFRGEAMASIAAVTHVEMKTRPHGKDLGTHIIIEGSTVILQEPCQCPVGTSLAIKNLFFNIPARRNFLKSNPVEMRHIVEEFQRVALANPKIFFSLHNNDIEIFRLPSANMRRRIVGIFGASFNERLVPVEEQTDFLRIYGFVGKPEYARKTRGEQYFFVNERFIKSSYLHHAVLTAYNDILPAKSHPLYVVFIDIDPARIDVNVHPTKQEIKFDDEKVVYTFVNTAVKRALGTYNITPTLDFDRDTQLIFSSSPKKKNPSTGSGSHSDKSFNISSSPSSKKSDSKLETSNLNFQTRTSKASNPKPSGDWQELYKTEDIQLPKDKKTLTFQSKANKQATFPMEGKTTLEKNPYQIHRRYILTQIKSGFILIDQKAAHERILYEQCLAHQENKKAETQKQLFPETIDLPPADATLLKQILPDINILGYDIQEFGQTTFVIHGVPADLKGGNEQAAIEQLLEQYKHNADKLKLNKRENLARSIARNTSLKVGQKMNVEEMQNLVDKLFACQTPFVAPNGKPTFVKYRIEDIEKQFDKKNG